MPKNNSRRSKLSISRKAGGVHRGRDRHISIRSELRSEPDLPKIARAIVAMAMAQAEKEAEEEATRLATDQGHVNGE